MKKKQKVREANGYDTCTNEMVKIFARKGEKVYNTNGK